MNFKVTDEETNQVELLQDHQPDWRHSYEWDSLAIQDNPVKNINTGQNTRWTNLKQNMFIGYTMRSNISQGEKQCNAFYIQIKDN